MKKKTSKNHAGDVSASSNIVLISRKLDLQSLSNDFVSHTEIISLRHPRNGESAQFLYNSNNGTMQECWRYTEKYRSWFIGNTINSEGTMLISTCIDPLFLILPFLRKSAKYRVFDEMTHDEDFPDSSKLECLVDEEQLSLVADKKDCGGLIVWKFNDQKTLEWLAEKTNRVANVLKLKQINVNTFCAISKTFVRTTSLPDHEYLRYAHGIVSEYLDPDLSAKFFTHLNLPSTGDNLKKRKNVSLSKDEIKRIKQECREKELLEAEFTGPNKVEKVTKKKAKHVALAKAAVGSKNISSFFKTK